MIPWTDPITHIEVLNRKKRQRISYSQLKIDDLTKINYKYRLLHNTYRAKKMKREVWVGGEFPG